MSTLNGQWLQIFRAGDYGDKGKYSVAQLAQLAAGYDPAKDEAPICIGHPTHNAPAFGAIKALKMDGDTLLGMPGDVPPVIDAAVQGGAYKKRSVALIKNADGSLRLRHLGLLGAMPPEVKGLADARFSEDPYQEVEFSQGDEMDQATLDRTIGERIAAFFSERFGGRTEPVTITQADVQRAATEAANAAAAAARTEFAAQLATERAAREAIELRFAATSATGRAEQLISGLKAANRWLPAYDHMGVPQLFAQLTSGTVTEIEFAQGGATVKKEPAIVLHDFLAGLKDIVPSGVTFNAADKRMQLAPEAGVNGRGVANVDQGSVDFSEKVSRYATEHKITFTDAYQALRHERPQAASSVAAGSAV